MSKEKLHTNLLGALVVVRTCIFNGEPIPAVPLFARVSNVYMTKDCDKPAYTVEIIGYAKSFEDASIDVERGNPPWQPIMEIAAGQITAIRRVS